MFGTFVAFPHLLRVFYFEDVTKPHRKDDASMRSRFRRACCSLCMHSARAVALEEVGQRLADQMRIIDNGTDLWMAIASQPARLLYTASWLVTPSPSPSDRDEIWPSTVRIMSAQLFSPLWRPPIASSFGLGNMQQARRAQHS